MESDPFPTTALTSTLEENRDRLVEFAEFWKIPYTTRVRSGTGQVIFSSGRIDQSNTDDNPIILSPTGPEDSARIASDYGLELKTKETCLQPTVRRGVKASLRTTVREFVGPSLQTVLSFDDTRILSRLEGSKIYFLSIDIVGEYESRLYDGLEDIPSTRFRLLSKFPASYNMVPSKFRNWSLRRAISAEGLQEGKMGSVECLRTIFLASLAVVWDRPIPRIAFWKPGKSYSMAITHDVETRRGLVDGAHQLLGIEKNLGLRSTWNIPSDRYPLSTASLREIIEAGDIGAHDTAHDGRLVLLSFQEKVSRAIQAREKLERLCEKKVRGFRAPLLQHSSELLTAVRRAGYEYDSSVPSWETLSPTSQKPHGVGTVFPLLLNGIWEIPVSLPQDHQLIQLQDLTPAEATKHTLQQARWIRGLNGSCILLVHPDYDYGLEENEKDYRHLLEAFSRDPACDIMTMREVADWWALRNGAQIGTVHGEPCIIPSEIGHHATPGMENLLLEFVTGYDRDGFRVEARQ